MPDFHAGPHFKNLIQYTMRILRDSMLCANAEEMEVEKVLFIQVSSVLLTLIYISLWNYICFKLFYKLLGFFP